MIIEMLFDLLYNLMSLLMILDIPDLPTELYGYINTAFLYIEAGAGVVANYTPFEYLCTLFFLLVAIDIGIGIYHLIMWIIKKIPMLGIQ